MNYVIFKVGEWEFRTQDDEKKNARKVFQLLDKFSPKSVIINTDIHA